MPSSGWGVEDISREELTDFNEAMKRADVYGMRREWLGSLASALRLGAAFSEACWAGIEEWDL